MAVRGAVAEVHLKRVLDALVDGGQIEGFLQPSGDGKPDFEVRYRGKPYLIECKNVEKEKPRKSGIATNITIDFQKTRNQREEGPEGRFYPVNHFSVIAACLWNRTGQWNFVYAPTATLPHHPSFPDRLWQKLTVDVNGSDRWRADLIEVLDNHETVSLSVGQVEKAIPLELGPVE